MRENETSHCSKCKQPLHASATGVGDRFRTTRAPARVYRVIGHTNTHAITNFGNVHFSTHIIMLPRNENARG